MWFLLSKKQFSEKQFSEKQFSEKQNGHDASGRTKRTVGREVLLS